MPDIPPLLLLLFSSIQAWILKISGAQFGSDFVAANPNSKIPAMLHFPNGDQVTVGGWMWLVVICRDSGGGSVLTSGGDWWRWWWCC
jgi:hypothetical protein